MASWQELPFSGPAYKNVDGAMLSQFSPVVENAYINEFEHTEKRPGLTSVTTVKAGFDVDGLFWWDEQETLLIVCGGSVYKMTEPDGTVTEISLNSGDSAPNAGLPAVFAKDDLRVYIATGAGIHHTELTTVTEMADADAPTSVSHVAFLDQYILANIRDSGTWQFSEVLDGLTWRAVDIVTAESSPDNLRALHAAFGEIVLLGAESIEFWVNDGISPFSVLSGTTMSIGVSSPYSFAVINGVTPFIFSNDRKLIAIRDRVPDDVSLPFSKELHSLDDVSDARGFEIIVGGLPLYILNFPNANRTFAYNYSKQDWSEWTEWDELSGTNNRWRGNCYAFARKWNKHYVGGHSNGVLYAMDRATVDDDGTKIRTVRRTPFVTHKTLRQKRSQEIRVRLKRGVVNSDADESQVSLRWRDGEGKWSNEHWKSLGKVGDDDITVTWRQLGSYTGRQYEIVHSDRSAFHLVGAEEMIEVLR